MVVQRYNLDRTTLSGNYANGGGRGGGRRWSWPGRRGWGCAGSAAARAALAGADRAAEALRHELAGGARTPRRREAHPGGQDRSRQPQVGGRDQPRAARRRGADDGAGDRGGAVRAEDRAARRGAHPRRGHERPERGRDDHRRHEGDRAADRHAAAGEPRAGDARRDRRRAAAHDHDRVVQLLQRLRPALHVVDGDAVRQGGRGPQELRGAAARQGRRGGPAGSGHARDRRPHRPGTAAEVRRRSRPDRDHRPAPGRDARHRRALQLDQAGAVAAGVAPPAVRLATRRSTRAGWRR